jgi:hypothetical protein
LTYLISPPEKSSTWSIDLNRFVEQIRDRWPEAQVQATSKTEGYGADVSLTMRTSKEEIVRPFLA